VDLQRDPCFEGMIGLMRRQRLAVPLVAATVLQAFPSLAVPLGCASGN